MLSNRQVVDAKNELRKVLTLAADGIAVQMFSKGIDSVWHQMLKDPEMYQEFSIGACGSIVGHATGHAHGTVAFIDSYERRWGKMPEIWFTEEDGSIDFTQMDEFRRTGRISASWNCRPTHNIVNPYQDDLRPDRSERINEDEQDHNHGQEPNADPARSKPDGTMP